MTWKLVSFAAGDQKLYFAGIKRRSSYTCITFNKKPENNSQFCMFRHMATNTQDENGLQFENVG